MSDDENDHGFGAKLIHTASGPKLAVISPHKAEDCASLCEQAEQLAHGHETAYEAPDAHHVRSTSVGYSKAYASQYDSVFGKN